MANQTEAVAKNAAVLPNRVRQAGRVSRKRHMINCGG